MLQQRPWSLSRWSGRQSLFAPTTIAAAAIPQEATQGIATPTTTELLMAVYAVTEVLCLGQAAGDKNEITMQKQSRYAKSIRDRWEQRKIT